MHYAGIGTRFPDSAQTQLCVNVGKYLAQQGCILHTGAAEGVDQIFARVALKAGGRVVLHIPWAKHEQAFRDGLPEKLRSLVEVCVLKTKKKERDYTAFDSVIQFHPAPSRLSWGAACMHARNYRIIIPEDEFPVDFVAALPSPQGGGTMQGVRLAKHYDIPVVRLDMLQAAEAQQQISELVRI